MLTKNDAIDNDVFDIQRTIHRDIFL